ncbi:MAG TPA: Smr/MutS family protein [Candidatus Polarisedimenticolia bacterium]|nr:Smr/MutS family protein [Candidatus Polarisedimenticolia bacterium]
MDQVFLAALEFPQVLDLLRAETTTPPGAALALSVRPSFEPSQVRKENELTLEAGRHLDLFGHLPFGTVPDPAPILDRLAVEGIVLAPLEVLDLLHLVKAARAGKSALTEARAACPGLWEAARELPDLGNLIRFLDGKISAAGEIEDHASDDLRLLRQDLRKRGLRLRELLDTIVGRPEVARALQDDFVSLRSERHVIPIRSESRSAVPGIVHGVSGTGATVYVEPIETVDLNNEIVTLRDREDLETRRLLREYSDLLRSRRADLRAASEGVGRLDLLMARARLGRKMRGRPASIAASGELVLREARHPLLEESLGARNERIVPIDLTIPAGTEVLIISGPNTGGKTVALKTAGLLSLMFQAGLLVPADEATLSVFRGLFIDIGDRQSIGDGLSTFSARMRTVSEIARRLEPPALVLLDEVGTGTDPEEGVALAIAIVDHFRACGATVIATTHLEALKAHASTTPGCANAAVEFDAETATPRFRLLPGIPGRSGGLEVAERLGVPGAILERARTLHGTTGTRVAEYLAGLERMSRELESRLRAVDGERQRLESERLRIEAALKEREEAQRRALAGEIELALQSLREAGDRYLASLKEREVAVRMRREEAKAAAPLRAEARRLMRSAAVLAQAAAPALVRGARVRVEGLGQSGVVEEVRGERIVVRLGGKRVTVPRDDCLPHPAGRGEARPMSRPTLPRGVTLERRPHQEAPAELHLRGRTVEDALELVDKYLDDAYLASLSPVRLVHGVGAGRLKRAIADLLSRHAHVEAYASAPPEQGGEGVTVVRLRV